MCFCVGVKRLGEVYGYTRQKRVDEEMIPFESVTLSGN